MILYLHGFRSSPLSFKARMLGERMQSLGLAAQYLCPQLPASPRQAMELLIELAEKYDPAQLCLIGSSLGGFYASSLAERLDCRAVLLNPAVNPVRELEKYIGADTQFHSDKPFEFKADYIAQLQQYAVPSISRPERYFLIAASGDEVLDWREMLAHYPAARHRIINGSDHGISDFARYLEEVLGFCGISEPSAKPPATPADARP